MNENPKILKTRRAKMNTHVSLNYNFVHRYDKAQRFKKYIKKI